MWLVDSTVRAVVLVVEMTWDTWWALVLGFALSGAVEAFVSEETMTAVLGDDGWREVGLGALFGAASSSCSYSAVGTAKTLFKKGASGVASLGAFMFASTDLVVELGLVVWVLLGWQFVVGEYFGGVVAVVVLALLFRHVVPAAWVADARAHCRAADDVVCPTCDDTVAVDDPETVSLETPAGTEYFCCRGCRRVFEARQGEEPASLVARLGSPAGWRSAARASMKDWEMLWDDIALGFLVAGVVGGFVPDAWWTALFTGQGTLGAVATDTLVAIVIGVATVMCSVGNVPFALVLWRNGLPYGAVLSFIYADLLIPPLVNVYRKYYGTRMAATLVVALALAAFVGGVVVHFVVGGLGLVPPAGEVGGTVPDTYTTVLNLVFTPVFLAQLVVTYGWETVRERTVEELTRVAARLRSGVLALTGTLVLLARAVAATLSDPGAAARAASGAASDGAVFDFRRHRRTLATAAGLARAAVRGSLAELASGCRQVATRVAETRDTGTRDEAPADGDTGEGASTDDESSA